MTKHAILVTLLSSVVLAACGGGGSASTNTPAAAVTPPQPVVTALVGTNGDLSKYLGTWVSDCGYNIIGTNQGKYQINTFRFTAVSGATFSGTLTPDLYSDIKCTARISVAGSSIPIPVTGTYVSGIAVTSNTPPEAQGTADKLTLGVTGSGITSDLSFGFYFNFAKFVTSTGTLFTNASLSYTKI